MPVCLLLSIEAPIASLESLHAHSRSPGALSFSVEPVRPWPWRPATSLRASISEQGGCACSLLADNADWNAPFWSMRPEILQPLAQMLAAVGEAAPDGFSVAALWAGDAAQREQIVSADELVTLARGSQLGTKTRYRVPSRR